MERAVPGRDGPLRPALVASRAADPGLSGCPHRTPAPDLIRGGLAISMRGGHSSNRDGRVRLGYEAALCSTASGAGALARFASPATLPVRAERSAMRADLPRRSRR